MKKCSICIHPMRNDIDKALISAISYRDIAGRFKISKSALQRHKTDHIPADLLQIKKIQEVCRAENILNKLISLKNDAARIAKKAETGKDMKTALIGIREQYRILEILAKIQGQIQQPQVSLTVNNLCLSKIYNRLGRKVEAINEIDS